MNEKHKSEFQELCIQNKAAGSKYIDPKSIAIGYWPRYKCQYGCPAYNKSLCCPPNCPSPDETKKIVSDYTLGLLVHFAGDISITKAIVKIEREIFLENYYKVISFGAGPCRLCKDCSKTECEFPQLARPSMEGCGIDVYATARNNGFSINVLKTKNEEKNCYGLLLIE